MKGKGSGRWFKILKPSGGNQILTHPEYEEINLSSTGKFENEFLVLINPIIQHVGDGTLLFRAQSRANKASWRVSHHLNADQPTSNASQIYPITDHILHSCGFLGTRNILHDSSTVAVVTVRNSTCRTQVWLKASGPETILGFEARPGRASRWFQSCVGTDGPSIQ